MKEPLHAKAFARWLDSDQGRACKNPQTMMPDHSWDSLSPQEEELARAFQLARLEQAYAAGFKSRDHHFRKPHKVIAITEKVMNSIRDFPCGHKPNGVGGKCDACEALKEWDALQ